MLYITTHPLFWDEAVFAVVRTLRHIAVADMSGGNRKSRSAAVMCLGLDLPRAAWKISLHVLSENNWPSSADSALKMQIGFSSKVKYAAGITLAMDPRELQAALRFSN